MRGDVETNVRVPVCVLAALSAVGVRWGMSRDATVRRLLERHIAAQEHRESEDRLTHISTVLRYPRPAGRGPGTQVARPLRLRAPADLLDRARAVSLRLPGQYRRSHRDYQARALTDAVMTAVAVVEPFTDEFLDGFRPLLRAQAALGLWQLATAATVTRPELILLTQARQTRRFGAPLPGTPASDGEDLPDLRHLMLVAEALENEVAWFSPARFHVAANVARALLTGPGADGNEQMLHQHGPAWHRLYNKTLHGYRRAQLLEGTTGYDWTGRGGTAVWRAHRRIELQDVEEWLVQPGTGQAAAERQVDRPGWLLRYPRRWQALAPTPGPVGAVAPPYEQWVAEGRLLRFPYRNRHALWPVTRATDRGPWMPVPDIDPIVKAGSRLRPDQVSQFIEAVLIDWNHEPEDEPSVRIALSLPIDAAHKFGFITGEARSRAMSGARASTLQMMDDVIEAFREDGYEDDHLAPLYEAHGRVGEFRRTAMALDKRIGSRMMTVRASWPWPYRSVVDALHDGHPPEFVQWLAAWAHKTSSRILEESMHAAWTRAFDQYGWRM